MYGIGFYWGMNYCGEMINYELNYVAFDVVYLVSLVKNARVLHCPKILW